MTHQGKGRPKGYYAADGERVPSVTTVLSRFKDAGPLMWWAWNEGMHDRDYRETRDKAADAGTLAHRMVEGWIHGQTPALDGVDKEVERKAVRAFGAFIDWSHQSKLEITHTEVPLVSQIHRYGGTIDGVSIKGKRCILDWKASKAIYPDHLIQVAAYGKLWEENYPDDPIEDGYHIVRFDKESGGFTHKWEPELEIGWKGFLCLRALYDIEKELKRRAK